MKISNFQSYLNFGNTDVFQASSNKSEQWTQIVIKKGSAEKFTYKNQQEI